MLYSLINSLTQQCSKTCKSRKKPPVSTTSLKSSTQTQSLSAATRTLEQERTRSGKAIIGKNIRQGINGVSLFARLPQSVSQNEKLKRKTKTEKESYFFESAAASVYGFKNLPIASREALFIQANIEESESEMRKSEIMAAKID